MIIICNKCGLKLRPQEICSAGDTSCSGPAGALQDQESLSGMPGVRPHVLADFLRVADEHL